MVAVIPGMFGQPPASLKVPCGRCIMCRIARSREWALRCLHEASSHSDSLFVTLTYNFEFLPSDLNINKCTLQKFIKRLRRRLEPRKIRYLMCGEYGDVKNVSDGSKGLPIDPYYWSYVMRGVARPHYHGIIFGLALHEHELELKVKGDQSKGYKCTGGPLYEAWKDPDTGLSMGHIVVGNVSYDSARYCVDYIFKQLTGEKRKGGVTQPFKLQSAGLGREYMLANREKLCDNIGLTLRGVEVGLPRYYQKKLLVTKQLRENYVKAAVEREEKLRTDAARRGVDEWSMGRYLRQGREQKEKNVVVRQKMKKTGGL